MSRRNYEQHELEPVRRAARDLEKANEAYADAKRALVAKLREAVEADLPMNQLCIAAGVTGPTLQKWLMFEGGFQLTKHSTLRTQEKQPMVRTPKDPIPRAAPKNVTLREFREAKEAADRLLNGYKPHLVE